jgi:hypothetical protein
MLNDFTLPCNGYSTLSYWPTSNGLLFCTWWFSTPLLVPIYVYICIYMHIHILIYVPTTLPSIYNEAIFIPKYAATWYHLPGQISTSLEFILWQPVSRPPYSTYNLWFVVSQALTCIDNPYWSFYFHSLLSC